MNDFFHVTFWDVLFFCLILWESYQNDLFAKSLTAWYRLHQRAHDDLVIWGETVTRALVELDKKAGLDD